MDIEIGVTKLIVVLLSLGSVLAENWAQLRLENDKYESSHVLKWIAENDTASLEDAGVGFADKIQDGQKVELHICRARTGPVDGPWVPGILLSNHVCQILVNGNVYDAEHYEVLYNVKKTARLVWKDWVMQTEIPSRAVCIDDNVIIARIASNDDYPAETENEEEMDSTTHRTGKIDFLLDRVFVDLKNREISRFESGQVLVEIRPRFYEVRYMTKLSSMALNLLNVTVLKLGEITLRNDLRRSTEIESVLPFQWPYRTKFSSMCDAFANDDRQTQKPDRSKRSSCEELIRGIDTAIYMIKPDRIERIKWDAQKIEIRNESHSFHTDLEAETEVKVTLQARLLEMEDWYIGMLHTSFEDGTENTRQVPMVLRRTQLIDFKLVYGPKFNLHNNSTTTITDSSTLRNSSYVTTTVRSTPMIGFNDTLVSPMTTSTSTTSSPPYTPTTTRTTSTTPPHTTTHSPTPVTSTEPSKFISLNISAYFDFQMRIPVK